VREGERTRVSDIRFEGNNSFHSDEIQSELKTKEAWILERAPVDADLIADDIGTIIQFYKDRGRLDVRVDRIITPSPNGKEAIVTFVIEEGPVYTLRSLKISAGEDDRRVFSPDQLMALMTVKPGDVYADDKMKKAMKSIEDAYGKLGYVDVEVRKREMRDTAEPLVDTVVVVAEGRRYLTGEVRIRGNRLTRDDVVRREIQLQPERPLDETAVADTERKLRNTGLFAQQPPPKVTIQDEDPSNPGYRDVLVEVDETNTGSINVGGAVNSDSGVLATLSVTQRNFDITSPPDSWSELWGGDAFRGGGQTFSIVAQPGTKVRNFSISLSDPTVNGSDFAGSASVYYRQRDYSSYTENRIGTRLSVGRRFGTRWNLNVPLRIENVSLDEIDSDAPVDYFAVQDDTLLFGLAGNISRSTLDDPIRPGSGTVTEFGLEEVVADESFQKLRAEWMTFFTLREDFFERKTVLNIRTRSEWTPQDSEQVPFYERYYLGGRNFRGFDFRGASPVGIRNDNGELGEDPIGGTFLFFLGAEVEQPVYEDLLSIVAFIDSGTVTDQPGFDAYRVSVGMGFRIYIPALSQAPLAFDFGIPILKEETDEVQNFNFSVDVPFN
ncbi:MAG: outer membrane protein assembly factor BamA, partial [bacterium]|nr:outer membrane protein assembly factor BamA [bacterium]